MAEANYPKTQSFRANVAVVAYRFAGPVAVANSIGLPSAGGLAIGVNSHDGAINETVGVVTESGVKVPVRASAAIAAGASIATTATGDAVTAASGNFILGIALEAATAADQYITMLFQPQGRQA